MTTLKDIMELTPKRLDQALKSLDTRDLVKASSKMSQESFINMLLSEMERTHRILSGKPYYDYETQEWIED